MVAGAVAGVVEGGGRGTGGDPTGLPPTVLRILLLVVLGPSGPGGALASLWGARTLAFTFPGLVIGSVLFSMPFVVQPIRNAFEAMGEKPLEAAATLRASPWRVFWTIAGAAGEPRISHRRHPRFAHTVGEFGVVLMIAATFPARQGALVAIYD